MKLFRMALVSLAMLGLAACYTSKAPLISEADSVAPFSRITFIPSGDSSPEKSEFVREGTQLVRRDEKSATYLRLKHVENDDYVAQLSGEKPDELLYGYIRITPVSGIAQTWMTAGDSAETRPGLSVCENQVCIDDLDAYIAYAREATAGEPTMTFHITVEP